MEMCVKCRVWCAQTDNNGHCELCEQIQIVAHMTAQARIEAHIEEEIAHMPPLLETFLTCEDIEDFCERIGAEVA